MKLWHAVAAKPRMELWARTNLWERDLEVYLPLVRRWRRHARRRDLVTRPLFPGYLFVHVDLDATSSRAIDMARGVKGLVRFGARPPHLPAEVIEGIRACEGPDGHIDLESWRGGFRAGEQVLISNGALADIAAIIESVDEKARLVVLLDIMGRQVRARGGRDRVSREG